MFHLLTDKRLLIHRILRISSTVDFVVATAMPEEQLLALVARLKADSSFREKLRSAPNSKAFAEIVKEAGYDVSHEQWLKHVATNSMAISDEELERISGGTDLSWAVEGKCWDYSQDRMANTKCDW